MTKQSQTSIIFFGTSEFAIPILEKLRGSDDFDIAAIVTQPDKPAGRKQKPLPSHVQKWALDQGLVIFQPEKLDPLSFSPLSRGRLRGGSPDLFIVASYGKIIPKEIIDLPKFGSLNIHPSLLPKYRGASPIHAAILNGDRETGVTIIKMDEKIDHGPIIASAKFEVKSSKLTYQELHDKLSNLGAELLLQTLPKYLSGEIKAVPQDETQASYTKIITKEQARIKWNDSAEKIDRMIRAYHLWPVAWTTLQGKRLKIYDSQFEQTGHQKQRPGSLLAVQNCLKVVCGQGILEIKILQPDSGREMTAQEFLRGHANLHDVTLT